MDSLMTKAQAAQVMNISQRSLDRILAEGKLRYMRVGSSVRIHPEDLRQYLSRCYEVPQAQQKSSERSSAEPHRAKRQTTLRREYYPGMKVV